MGFILEYPFRISEIAGRAKTNDFRDDQQYRKDKEFKQLDKVKSKLIKAHFDDKITYVKLAEKYNVSTYRMAQYFREKKLKKSN